MRRGDEGGQGEAVVGALEGREALTPLAGSLVPERSLSWGRNKKTDALS